MPNGGYILAVALRALGAELDMPDPVVVSAFFLRRTEPGPVELHTDIARIGRRHATGGVRMLQHDDEVLRAAATFTDFDNATGETVLLNDAPDLPAPEECADPLRPNPFPWVTIIDRLDYRFAEVPGSLDGRPSGRPSLEFWMRFKDDRPLDTLSLVALVDAAAPAVIELGKGSVTMELTVHVRARPAAGPWMACRSMTKHIVDGYHEEDFEIWDSNGHLVAESRQLALLRS
jgi:acyl-CoA thioesterase